MLHNLLHNKVLHERIVFLTVHNEEIPHVPLEQGIALQALGHDCWQLDLSYGFKDQRDIPQALAACAERGLKLDMMQVSFFVARQTVVPTVGSGMALWREGLFATMSRQARDAADYFKVPPNRVIELGTQIEI
jgi:KUP system potassium uptake protein